MGQTGLGGNPEKDSFLRKREEQTTQVRLVTSGINGSIKKGKFGGGYVVKNHQVHSHQNQSLKERVLRSRGTTLAKQVGVKGRKVGRKNNFHSNGGTPTNTNPKQKQHVAQDGKQAKEGGTKRP